VMLQLDDAFTPDGPFAKFGVPRVSSDKTSPEIDTDYSLVGKLHVIR